MTRATRRLTAIAAVALVAATSSLALSAPAQAASYVPISGAGSTWSQNAISAWQRDVAQYGMVVNYSGVGSTTGRNDFKQGTVAWAASDIPYGVQDGTNFDPPPTTRGFAYMPDTAGGTVFMYNLKIGARRVTNLRLSGPTIAKIFTGVITTWNDPAIAADNPGLTLPATPIVPVVRSDGSGSTAQFTQWMLSQQPSEWKAYCAKVGRDPCTQTSAYPVLPGSNMVGQPGDLGVSGYVSQQQAVGSIGYVEYSYALETGFPVAKMLNAAGYYTEPTPGNVAVALLKAKINMDQSNPNTYLTQDLSQVYVDSDARTYPLSSYSYMILPTDTVKTSTAQNFTLGDFGKYLLCQGQNQVDALGYSALPINLVEAGFDQLKKMPGATDIPSNVDVAVKSCNNPTLTANGTNALANTDPFPPACDKQGPSQCVAGTGGAKQQPTPVKPGAQAGNPGTPGGSSTASGGNSNGTGTNGSNGTGSGGGTNGSGGGTNGVGGTTNATSPGGSTTLGGTSGAAGAAGSANAVPVGPAVQCDPDTGCGATAGSSQTQAGGLDPLPAPTSASASLGDNLRVTLMALASALLLGLGLGPPLVAHLSARRRQRRVDAS